MNKTLYKYRTLNKYTKNIFIENKFWYASISSLNDPNEGLIKKISENASEKFIIKTKESQLHGFISSLFMGMVPPAEKEKILENLGRMESLDRKYRYMRGYYINNYGRRLSKPESFFDSISNIVDNAGVLSLSDNPLNTLMWSHYADNHKGIAVGITDYGTQSYTAVKYVEESNVPEIDLEKLMVKVSMYSDHNTYEMTFDDPSIQNVLTTKTNHWDYEGEWRGLKEKFGSYEIEGKISEIIFGLNCDPKVRNELIELIKNTVKNPVTFKEVCRNSENYKLFLKEFN